MTLEEELELWRKIESVHNAIRLRLYRLAYIIPEHIKILEEANASNLSDFFPVSVFSIGDSGRGLERAVLDMQPWRRELSEHYNAMVLEFSSGRKRRIEKMREESERLLMRYPVHGERLFEWYNVAEVYRSSLSAPDVSADARRDIEKRILMNTSDFCSLLDDVAPYFDELSELKKRVVTVNLRLVVSIVKHYHSDNIQTSDLIQEGNIGLIKALEKFDYKLGHKFSTYATWWIKQSVSRAIASQSRVIRLPAHMLVTISRINRAEQTFILQNGRDPGTDELAEILELPRERISAIKKMTCQVISLQAPVSGEDGNILENLLSEGESSDPVKNLSFKLMKARLMQAMETLSEREQQILKMRFGLGGEQPRTLVEVSRTFNLTRERIRQIEFRAIKKLRAPDLAAFFEDYFY